MSYLSVGNDDELVIIVFVERSGVLMAPVEINPLLWKRHANVEDFMLDKCVRFFYSHKQPPLFFDISILQKKRLVKRILAKTTLF